MNLKASLAACLLVTVSLMAQTPTRVVVTIENLAPVQGTAQTPFWVGFHDGTFDTYDRDQPASFRLGNNALERLAEDGNTGPITQEFAAAPGGSVDATLAGPNGPILPGDIARKSFLLDGTSPLSRYFSYASMVLPSNDAFVANGNPLSHPIFDGAGTFIGQPFFITGSQVLDAGTEVNDEVPANTAFFGQMQPNTGINQNGLVVTHDGFLRAASGGILGDARFRAGDFLVAGYPIARVNFRAVQAITDQRQFFAIATGSQEIPPVATPAFSIAGLSLVDDGTKLVFFAYTGGLQNLVSAHLHLGGVGAAGPVVANLITPRAPGGGGAAVETITAELTAENLQGPFAGAPLDELVLALSNGGVYMNLHTSSGLPGANPGPGNFASGEVRGQFIRIQ